MWDWFDPIVGEQNYNSRFNTRIKLHFRQMDFLVETLHIFRKAFVLVLKSSHGLHLNKKGVRENSLQFSITCTKLFFFIFCLFIDIQYSESNFNLDSNNKNLNRHIITNLYYILFFYLIILIIELYWINENVDNSNECNTQLIK